MEVYKEIPNYKNYLVSNYGNVKSKRYNKTLKGSINTSGYKRVQIGSNKNKQFIHRLVAITFLEKDKNKLFVNHIDGNKLNNSAKNLEWVTRSENDLHAFRNDLRKSITGAKHHNSKLTLNDVLEIKMMLKKGYSCSIIAEKYPVNRRTINDIKLKRIWK